MKAGVRIAYRVAKDRRMVDRIPMDRDCIVVWRDRFGTINVTGWGPSIDIHSRRFDRAINSLLNRLRLNPIIERNADERGVPRTR